MRQLHTGGSRAPHPRFFVILAALALLLGLSAVRPPAQAFAASGDVVAGTNAAPVDDQLAATISNDDSHHCLAGDYDGRVYLSACGNPNYYQQWQGVGGTLVNMQTGLCLDGNEKGSVYSTPCAPGQKNPYQTWGKSGKALGNRQTKLFLTGDSPDHVMAAGAYLGFAEQKWTITALSGACDIEPLTMDVEHPPTTYWKHEADTQESPEDLGGPWTFTVNKTYEHAATATTTVQVGAEFTVDMFKASGSTSYAQSATNSESISISSPFGPFNVPRGQTVWATYGAHMAHVEFHWHRTAKDCTDLNSPRFTLDAPYAQGFDWNCDTSKDANCKKVIEDANPGTTGTPPKTNGVRSDFRATPDAAQPYYWFDPTVRPGPPPPPPQRKPTSVTYTGPTAADYHAPFTASARVTSGGSPVSAGSVTFTLGGSTCTGSPGPSGTAACVLTPKDTPGPATLRVSYSGTGQYQASSTQAAFTIRKAVSTLRYTGVQRVANGEPAALSGVLTEGETGKQPIAGRAVTLALGTGDDRQACSATTDAHGSARCTIGSVDQPLNAAATVPVSAGFAGDAYYLPSHASAEARLEYYTGQATGLTAAVHLPLVTLALGPTPDTGLVRTASATRTQTPCTASAGVLLLHAEAVCPQVTTRLKPGTAESQVRISDVRIGLPGLPVIGISGLTATSTSTCEAATGSTRLTLTVAGGPVTVPTRPNSTIPLPGGGHITVDEQAPVADADTGLTVTAAHIVLPGLGSPLADISLGTATSAAHNCR